MNTGTLKAQWVGDHRPGSLRIAGLLENTARVKNFGRSDKDEEQQDSLTEYFHCLEPLAPFPKKFAAASSMWDEIADDASPALKKIRRSMVLTGERFTTN